MRSVPARIFQFFLVLFAIQVPALVYFSKKIVGWDHEIYCRALDVWNQGADPFLNQNLGLSLSYVYPLLFLKVYAPLCALPERSFVFLQFVLLLGLFFLVPKNQVRAENSSSDKWLVFAWIFFGFNAAYANYTSGNVGVFEALCFAVFFLGLVSQKKSLVAGAALVPIAFLKWIPGVFLVPAIVSEPKWKRRLTTVLPVAAGVAVLQGVSYLLDPPLYFSYWNQVLGRYYQHSPVAELDSNPSNLTVVLFFKNLAARLVATEFHDVLFGVFLLGLAAFSMWLWKKKISTSADFSQKISWMFLILFLWLPRLKPYSLLVLILVLIPILQWRKKRVGWGLLLLSIFHRVINGDKTNPWWDFLANNSFIYAYILILVVLAVTVPPVGPEPVERRRLHA